jgi:ABC-type multidrug transport system fused ATPase/permease subunit
MRSRSLSTRPRATAGISHVTTPRWASVVSVVLLGSIGALVGAVVPSIAGWGADQSWVPLQRPFRAIDGQSSVVTAVALIVVGVLAGLWLAYWADRSVLKAEISDTAVTLHQRGYERAFHATAVSAAFFDRKELVLLGGHTEELLRRATDLSSDRYRSAFTDHAYLWLDEDPYAHMFHRWIEGDPALPAGTGELLTERARAVAKRDVPDCDLLKARLANLGLVVRDDKRRQLWRPLVAQG